MPQNLDTKTGQYHADPLWRRYQPQQGGAPKQVQNQDPRQSSNLDPATGQYHADPMWRRYQPQANAGPSNLDVILGGLKEATRNTPYDQARNEAGRRQAAGIHGQISGDINLAADPVRTVQNEPVLQPSAVSTSRPAPIQQAQVQSQSQVPTAVASSNQTSPAMSGLRMSSPHVQAGAPDPAESLRILQNSPGQANDSLKLQRFRNDITGGDNLSSRSLLSDSGTNVHGLGGNMSVVAQETDADPYTGTDAQDAATRGLQHYQSAVAQGFRGTDPVGEQAEAGRQAETYKIDAPVRAADMSGRWNVAERKMQNQGALDVENERAQSLRDVATTRESGYEARAAALSERDKLNAQARVAGPLARTLIPEMQRIQEGFATGKMDRNAPEGQQATQRYEELNRMLQGATSQAGIGQQSAAPTDADSHARELVSKYRGRSASDILAAEEDPNNPDGIDFNSPQDRETLHQALLKAGAR